MSTLHVENLKGLSSGGNANKIIVPSGQTLDASNGFVAPAGHVIQVVNGSMGGSDLNLTSASWADIGLSAAITPSSTSSKIIVTASFQIRVLGTQNATLRGGFRGLRDSTNVWNTSSYDETQQIRESGTEWNDTVSFRFIDSPSTTSSTTYKIQGYAKAGTVRVYNATRGGQIILEEVAQ